MARANGKVILFGEHAVVYGVRAVAAGIDRGARAVARPAAKHSIRVRELEAHAGDGTELGQALYALVTELGCPPCAVTVDLELPPGCGLGASAAIGVAAARAMLEAAAPDGRAGPGAAPSDTERAIQAAMAWERVFHGNPSGIDPTAAALGGCISYVRGARASPVRLATPLRLAVAVAGPGPSTREMVERVARLRLRNPDRTGDVLESISDLVGPALVALAEGDVSRLGNLLDQNHDLLRALDVSTDALDRACDMARAAGASGAKLTGAGGGGAVIALIDNDPEPVLRAWRGAGLDCFETRVGSRAPTCASSGGAA